MVSYMRLCDDCDRLQSYPQTCYTLLMEGYDGVFGHLIEPTVNSFSWNGDWAVNHEHKTIKLLKTSLEERRDAIDRLLWAEREKGTFRVLKKWTGERFPIFGPDRELVVDLERSASGLFVMVTYGVQLITYREDEDGLLIWAARRSPEKTLYPNRLVVTVGGSLPAGETPCECLIREAHEEAGLESQLVESHAKSAGTISYVISSETKTTSGGESGLIRAEIQYIYDMKVGKDVVPTPSDMEASDINLYSVNEIKKALGDGELTPANACLMLDFFIRHGIVTYENKPRQRDHQPPSPASGHLHGLKDLLQMRALDSGQRRGFRLAAFRDKKTVLASGHCLRYSGLQCLSKRLQSRQGSEYLPR